MKARTYAAGWPAVPPSLNCECARRSLVVTRFSPFSDEWGYLGFDDAKEISMMDSMNGGGTADMVKALAGLPEEARGQMIRDRLETFASLGDEQRQAAMTQMVQAVLALPDGDRRALVRTRTAVLLDLDEATRMRLMGTHMSVLQGLGPEAMMRDMATIQSIVPDLPPEKQRAIGMVLEQMQGGGMAMAASSGAPAHATEPPAARRKPWWRFWG